jgi:hypothetical protein
METINDTQEIKDVETNALTVVEEANALIIKTSDDYIMAGEFYKKVKALRDKVSETFDPLIASAHKLHKDTLNKKNEIDKPLEGALRHAKKLMSDYDAGQERIRLAEQRRLEEEARIAAESKRAEELAILEAEHKAEQERLLAAAVDAEKMGNTVQAEELMQLAEEKHEEVKQEAERILEPVSVAPVVLPKATPKLNGGPVFRPAWKFKIIDAGKIPREYMFLDEVKIGQIVRAMKGQTNIPGVTAYEERV